MTTYQYERTLIPDSAGSESGNIKVKNCTGYFDKKKGEVIFTMWYKVFDQDTSDADHFEFSIGYFGDDTTDHVFSAYSTVEVTPNIDKWTFIKLVWNAGKELDLINHGEIRTGVRIKDPELYGSLYIRSYLDIDLDPVEHHVTVTNYSFGAGVQSVRPSITWTMTDLFQTQFMNEPTFTVELSTGSVEVEDRFYVTFDDDTSTAQLAGGVVNINGVPISECPVPFSNTRTYFKRIKSFKLDAHDASDFIGMEYGINKYTLNMKCEGV